MNFQQWRTEAGNFHRRIDVCTPPQWNGNSTTKERPRPKRILAKFCVGFFYKHFQHSFDCLLKNFLYVFNFDLASAKKLLSSLLSGYLAHPSPQHTFNNVKMCNERKLGYFSTTKIVHIFCCGYDNNRW